MSRITIFVLSLFIAQMANSQSRYCNINGEISDNNFKDTIYLIKGNKAYLNLEDAEIVSWSITNKGMFSFKIPISYTDYYSVKSKKLKKGFVLICSPKDNIKLKCDTSDFYHPAITGSKENTLRHEGIAGRDPLILKMNSYADSASYSRKDSVEHNKFISLNNFWNNEIKEYNLRFIRKNPKCLTSLDMYNDYLDFFSKYSVRQYLKGLPKTLQNNPLAKDISYKKFVLDNELKKISKFYDIKFYDTLSRPFSFNSCYGKLILIDYWASWCKPCIENFPELKKIEEKYKKQGFVIIGISLDINLKKWKNEIKRSQLSWENISDGKGADGLGAKFLKITTIPRYVLIGKDGVIITDNANKEELEKIISENL